jgi:hypothetical protein
MYVSKGGHVHHLERLLGREAAHAHEAATEPEALVSLLPSEKSRQLAHVQAKSSHKQLNDFRDLALRVKESERHACSLLGMKYSSEKARPLTCQEATHSPPSAPLRDGKHTTAFLGN